MINKILNVIVPLKAVSPRNLTSLLLVAIFFAVYVLSGGRIKSVPKVELGRGFGSTPQADIKVSEQEEIPNDGFSDISRDISRDEVREDKRKETLPKKEEVEDGSSNAFGNFQDRLDRIGRD